MPWSTIEKRPAANRVVPNLRNYEELRSHFSWEQAGEYLDGLSGGKGLNMAYEAVDRHATGARRDHVALRWLGKQGEVEIYTYGQLQGLTNRFANVLQGIGIGKGDRVFTLLDRIPALFITALGTLKNGSVFSPLFSAFGPDPIATRLALGAARVLVVSERLYQLRKIAELRAGLADLERVIVVGENGKISQITDTEDFYSLLAEVDKDFSIPPTDPGDMALLHFTSGTTGRPKAAIHVHGAAIVPYLTGHWVLDFHPEDVFWCTADPGWVTGIFYGMLAPLLHGITNIVDQGGFEPTRWYRILREQRVSVWYTAPTAIRMMKKYGTNIPRDHDFSHLRLLASVGEPLGADAVVWGQETFGSPFHDTWWQTETGGIMIANYPAMAIKPGSMGRPLPGIEAVLVARTPQGITLIEEPGQEGELALRQGWPSMFRGYLGEEERYRKCFAEGYYLTGDLAKRDKDGYFWFVGRADDVIKSAGHLIGPFEVESVLLEHPAVAEAGVIGKPDPMAGEVVKAFVALKPGFQADEALYRALLALARERLGATVAPKEIVFQASLPKTRSGKIMRRLLKAREMGLPEADLSTLEKDEF